MYKHLLSLNLLLLSVENASQYSRIINGKPISIESVPAQASLFLHSTFICGVVLISRRTAITAAHCVTQVQYQSETLQVHYGSNNIQSESRISVIRVAIFPVFDKFTLNFDFAVLTLSHSVNVTFAKLSQIGEEIPDKTSLAAVGWGITELGSTSPKLLMTNLITIPLDECRNAHPTWLVSENMFCAIGDGTTTCQGDSGSGIYMMDSENFKPDVLVGLVSWGDNKCSTKPAKPTGFVDLSNRQMRNWLRLLIV